MHYYIKLSKEKRITEYFETERPMEKYDGLEINEIPEGDISDYIYSEGKFIYSPLPESEPMPSMQEQIDDINIVLADLIGGGV